MRGQPQTLPHRAPVPFTVHPTQALGNRWCLGEGTTRANCPFRAGKPVAASVRVGRLRVRDRDYQLSTTTATNINQLQVRKGRRDVEAIRVAETYGVQHDLVAADESVCV